MGLAVTKVSILEMYFRSYEVHAAEQVYGITYTSVLKLRLKRSASPS